MSDLISRKALLDKLTPWLAVAEYGCGKYNLLSAICELIRRAPEADNWISVKDRLPEPFEDVLTYDGKCKIIINWLEEIEDGIPYFAYSGKNIIHWMPLPEPPKENRSNE